MFRQLNKGLCIKFGSLFIITLLLVACGNDEASQGESSATDVVEQPTMSPTADPDMLPVLAAIADAQREVDFTLSAPSNIEGFRFVQLDISGPEASPRVMLVLADDSRHRSMSLMQSAQEMGNLSPEGAADAPEIVFFGDIEATYVARDNAGSEVAEMRWEDDGVHFVLGTTGVSKDEVIEFASGIAAQ